MNVLHIIRLALRNYIRNFKRHRFLAIAVVLVVVVFTFIFGTVTGMSQALRSKASRYFSGDITIQQMYVSSYPSLPEADFAEAMVKTDLQASGLIVRRSVYYQAGEAELFFKGASLRQRRLVGVDWQNEAAIISGMNLVAGSVPGGDDHEAVIISTITADSLGLSIDDRLTIRLTTEDGQINSATYVVRAIFSESSLFGFSSYLHRESLNRLMAKAPDAVSELGLFLDNSGQTKQIAEAIHSRISVSEAAFPLVSTRQQRDLVLGGARWEDGKFLIMTLDAQLAEITDLVNALWLISLGLILLFAVLVSIGVSNTYSFLVLERTSEIGAMRAMGISKSGVLFLFLAESFFMSLFCLAFGIASGIGIMELIRFSLNLGSFELASLFLVQGRLQWILHAGQLVSVVLVTCVSILTGCWFSALKGARLAPVEALRHQ